MKSGIDLIQDNKEHLNQLCKSYQVGRLYLFGSMLTDRFDQNGKSDMDFLVEMDTSLSPLDQGENLLQLWNALEKLFQRPIDLLTSRSINNPILKRQIEAQKILFYERKGTKISV